MFGIIPHESPPFHSCSKEFVRPFFLVGQKFHAGTSLGKFLSDIGLEQQAFGCTTENGLSFVDGTQPIDAAASRLRCAANHLVQQQWLHGPCLSLNRCVDISCCPFLTMRVFLARVQQNLCLLALVCASGQKTFSACLHQAVCVF